MAPMFMLLAAVLALQLAPTQAQVDYGCTSAFPCSGADLYCYPYRCSGYCQTSPCSGSSSCSRGEYLSSGSCRDCPSGRYQASYSHSDSSCDWCPSGEYQPSTGSSSCRDCPSGTSSSDRTYCLSTAPPPSPPTGGGGSGLSCSTLGGHDSDGLLGGRVSASIPGVGTCFFDNQSDLEAALRRAGDNLEDEVCYYLSEVGCLAHPECCGFLETCEQPDIDTSSFGEMLTTGAQSMLGTCELSIGKLVGFVIAPILVILVIVCCCCKKSTEAKDPQVAMVALPAASAPPTTAPPTNPVPTKLVPTNPVSTGHVAITIAEPSPAPPAAVGGGTNLQTELSLLKMPELRKRAQEAGISEDAVEEARDQDDPKQAVIALIVNAGQAKVEAAAREAATLRAVKAELQQLKMPDLRKRAAAAGASAEAIEAARDGDDPKADMIELILAHQSSQP